VLNLITDTQLAIERLYKSASLLDKNQIANSFTMTNKPGIAEDAQDFGEETCGDHTAKSPRPKTHASKSMGQKVMLKKTAGRKADRKNRLIKAIELELNVLAREQHARKSAHYVPADVLERLLIQTGLAQYLNSPSYGDEIHSDAEHCLENLDPELLKLLEEDLPEEE
jgi:hypothetical protein